MIPWILGAVVALFAFKMWTGYRSPSQVGAIKAAVTSGAPLIDVRTSREFDTGHLPAAICLPLNEIGGRIATVAKPGATVVLYCATGTRSAAAARALRQAGYTVLDLGRKGNWDRG